MTVALTFPFASSRSALLMAAGAVSAETLLTIQRVQKNHDRPARPRHEHGPGRSRFGAPSERLDARGGQKRQWPTINRWSYPAFIVYFEKDKVIDAVANQAGANEVGPKPPIR